jgi:hypothetical protein
MKLNLERFFALALLLGLFGCAGSHVLTGQPRAPIDPSQVKLYTALPNQFEEIALLEANSSLAIGDQAQMDSVIERLKEQAARLGANGIVLGPAGSVPSGSVGTGVGRGSGSGVFGIGVSTAIFQKSAQARAIYVPEQ